MATNEGSVGFELIKVSESLETYCLEIISSVDTSNPGMLPTPEVCSKARVALHSVYLVISNNYRQLSSNILLIDDIDIIDAIAALNTETSRVYSTLVKPLRAIIAFDVHRIRPL